MWSGLVYGCESIYMNKKSLKLLDTVQAKHLKAILGLNYFTYNKPLLKAIGIDFISNSVLISSLELFRMNILSSSATSDFYKFMLKCSPMHSEKSLLDRARSCCVKANINMILYMFNDAYRNRMKRSYNFVASGTDCVIDLRNYNRTNRVLLNNMLMAF